MRVITRLIIATVLFIKSKLEELGRELQNAGELVFSLLIFSSVLAELLHRALFLKAISLVLWGADIAAILQYTLTGLKSSLVLMQLELELSHRCVTLASLSPLNEGSPLRSRPASDIDLFSSTDFEEAMTFAADVFEFLNQEYAMLASVMGEGHFPLYVSGGSVVLNNLYRTVSSRRFK